MNKDSHQPLVSVIVPAYNRGAFIEEALDSVLRQTYSNFELIVVDDGSTDDTAQRLENYRSDPRVTLLHQENQGQAAARNLALKQASGEFLCFLDSDNYWPANKLERQLSIFEHSPEYDIVYGDIVIIDEDGREVTRENMTRKSGRITKWLMRDNSVSINTALFRRKCYDELGGQKAAHRAAPDYELWLRYSTCFEFKYVPEFWAYYRVMEDQLSSDKTRRFRVNEEMLIQFQQEYPAALSKADFAWGMAFFYLRKARYLASVGQRREAFTELRRAFVKTPANPLVYRTFAVICLKRSW